MAKIGLFYGSTTGNTLKVAEKIQQAFLPLPVGLHDVRTAIAEDLKKYDLLILGTSTWHWGGLQDEWAAFEGYLDAEHLRGKKVALFGVGDQLHYAANFADGLGILYDRIKPLKVEVIGAWPCDDYEFDASAAIVDGKFVGLVLDEENQTPKTPGRIRAWVEQIKKELNGHPSS